MLTRQTPVPAVNVDELHQAPQGAVANPFAQLGITVQKLIKPVNPALFKMDEEGNLAVALNDRAVRYDAAAGTAVDVTGTVVSVPANGIIAIPATKLETGDLFVSNDVPFTAIADDGKTVEGYNHIENKIERIVPPTLAIAPELRDVQKVVFIFKDVFDDALEGLIISSMMSGKAVDFQALIQGRLVKSCQLGDTGGDLAKFAFLGMMGNQPGSPFAANGMQGLLPLLLLGKGGDAGKADLKTLMLISMMGQNGGAANGMQNILPLLFLGGKDKGSLLPLALCMGMAGQQGEGPANPLQSLLPLALLGKGKGAEVGEGLGDIFKSPLALMMLCNNGGGGANNFLPLMFLGKSGLFGKDEAAAPAAVVPTAEA